MIKEKRIALFITCLVDNCAPEIGFDVLKVFEHCGIQLEVPAQQICCGQPGYNAGYFKEAADVAHATYLAFKDFDYIVAPSGSCIAMIRNHYPKLLKDKVDHG